MTSVLITGASGFVGSAVGRHLRAAGWHVTGLSRRPCRSGAADLEIRHDLSQPLPDDLPGYDVIIHAAALSSPWASPQDYADNIVRATANLLDFAARMPPQHFIHISTTAVFYTDGDQTDVTEATPMPEVPINNYASAKRQAENLVSQNAARFRTLILRPRAVYGPGDTVLFPRILRAAKWGLLPRIIRADGQAPQADLIYIGNLSHGVTTAIERELSGAINVTDGQPVDTHRMLADVLGKLGYRPRELRLPINVAMAIAGGLEWTSATLLGWREPPLTRFGVSTIAHTKTFDVTRMRESLGPPPFTTEQGIDAFVDWQRAGAEI